MPNSIVSSVFILFEFSETHNTVKPLPKTFLFSRLPSPRTPKSSHPQVLTLPSPHTPRVSSYPSSVQVLLRDLILIFSSPSTYLLVFKTLEMGEIPIYSIKYRFYTHTAIHMYIYLQRFSLFLPISVCVHTHL